LGSLPGPGIVEVEMIVIVIRIALVVVHEILTQQMVGERVALLLVVRIGHRGSFSFAVMAWRMPNREYKGEWRLEALASPVYYSLLAIDALARYSRP